MDVSHVALCVLMKEVSYTFEVDQIESVKEMIYKSVDYILGSISDITKDCRVDLRFLGRVAVLLLYHFREKVDVEVHQDFGVVVDFDFSLVLKSLGCD